MYFLQNLYNFATPLYQENPHFDFIVLVPQLTNTTTVLSRVGNCDLEIIFENDMFFFATSPFHKDIKTSCPLQTLFVISQNFDVKDYYFKLELPNSPKELKLYGRSCQGGTYDHIHAGHRLFLSFTALVTRNYMLVGLTSDSLLTKKTHQSAIQSFETRYQNTERFLNFFAPNLKVDIVMLNDPVGPPKDGDFDVVVVTPETLKGGEYINKVRKEGGFKELEIVVSNLVSNTGEIKDKLSSTHIREVVLAKVGDKAEILEGLYQEWIELMGVLGIDNKGFVGLWFDKLKEKYCETWRYYHTLVHVWHLLRACNDNLEKIKENDVVKLATWFHDVIYIPQKGDNEKESVKFFEEFVKDLEARLNDNHLLTKEKQEKVKKIILYTINHTQMPPEVAEWFDAKFFLDIDLGILGAESDIYMKYARDVRMEYCYVPEELFRKKRAEFMKKFANKELEIYKTEFMKEKFEEKAINNVTKEIEMLLGDKQAVADIKK